jgi:hypothetical protein
MEQQDKLEKGKPGRKPGKDNKIPLTVYVEQSVISKIGGGWLMTGRDKAKQEAVKAIYELAKQE